MEENTSLADSVLVWSCRLARTKMNEMEHNPSHLTVRFPASSNTKLQATNFECALRVRFGHWATGDGRAGALNLTRSEVDQNEKRMLSITKELMMICDIIIKKEISSTKQQVVCIHLRSRVLYLLS